MKPTTNRKDIELAMTVYGWPSIDLADPDQIRERTVLFYRTCQEMDMKPALSMLCGALGTNRNEVLTWARGKHCRLASLLTPESAHELQNSMEIQESLWESAMSNNGYTHPVAGIFLGKNNYGYKDASESVVRHETAERGPTRAELEAKYTAAIPIDAEVEGTNSKRLNQGDEDVEDVEDASEE